MKLQFAKSNWEVSELRLPEFIERVAAAGFDMTEIYLEGRDERASDIVSCHEAAGLGMIAQLGTRGRTAEEHMASLESGYVNALAWEPLLVNAHTGRDLFSRDDNLRIFESGLALTERYGVPLYHETHRSRALYSGPGSADYLDACPELRITADFSHWFCVHESDLSDQEENLSKAVAATRHVHARVGFAEGPQVGDPRNPVHAGWLTRHVELWRRIVAVRKAEGAEWLTITPEFGPLPYLPLAGLDERGAVDPWELNLWIRDFLKEKLAL